MLRKYTPKVRGKYQKPDKKEKAVNVVKNGTLSVRQDAEKFSVAKSTLYDRCSGKISLDAQRGRKPVIPKEVESQMINTVIKSTEKEFGISRRELMIKAGKLSQRLNIGGFKNKIPTKYYCIIDKPAQTWNCDETGKQLEDTPVGIVARKGSRNVVSRTSNNRSNITIMACVNAAGDSMPTMLLVKGKTEKGLYGYNTAEVPSNTVWTYQKKAWIEDSIGEEWFKNVFFRNRGKNRPQLLILDGHGSHESLGLLELAERENIAIHFIDKPGLSKRGGEMVISCYIKLILLTNLQDN